MSGAVLHQVSDDYVAAAVVKAKVEGAGVGAGDPRAEERLRHLARWSCQWFLGDGEATPCAKLAPVCAIMVTNGILMTMSAKPRELPAGEFKAKCLAVLDDVQRTGRSVVVTKRGRPVAQVVPLPAAAVSLRGSLLYEDDLLTPIDVEWDANR
jgi:prevent-host-death family protein